MDKQTSECVFIRLVFIFHHIVALSSMENYPFEALRLILKFIAKLPHDMNMYDDHEVIQI